MFALLSKPALLGTREEILGTEAVWQKPSGAAKGLLFLAHGCNHGAIDFWPRSPACAQCIGLPEEVRITRDALQAGWAVVAMSSSDRARSRCWNFDIDGPAVAGALGKLREAQGLAGYPLAALGASSGGAFVLQLPQLVPGMRAVVSQIMAIPPQMLISQGYQPFPPVLFLHMARDARTAALVDKCLRKLKASGLKAAAIEVPPLAIDDSFFAHRIASLGTATSQRLRRVLDKAGLLDAAGKLIDDPRGSAWRDAVRGASGLLEQLPGIAPGVADSLQADESAVAEELNVAWAAHEITADFMAQTLAWIDSKGGALEDSLVAEL